MNPPSPLPIGLFFGSFNPLHNGHVAIADYLLEHGYCREIWFVVSPRNPWKEDGSLLEENKRLAIVQAAIAGKTGMAASDLEFNMPRPSYTYQTLRAFRQKYPDTPFALIIGGDNLQRFHEWRHHREILNTCPLLVYPRPGIPLPPLTEGNIRLVNAPLTPVSSTAIRQMVKTGKDISSLVPPEALPLILKYYTPL